MRYFIILFITLCLVSGLGAQKFLVEPENKKIAEFNYYADEYKNKELYTDEILLFSEKEVNRLLQESKNLVFNNEDTNSGELLNLYKKVIIKPNNYQSSEVGKIKIVTNISELKSEIEEDRLVSSINSETEIKRYNQLSNDNKKEFLSEVEDFSFIIFEKLIDENQKIVMYIDYIQLEDRLFKSLKKNYNSENNKLKEKMIESVRLIRTDSDTIKDFADFEMTVINIKDTLYSIGVFSNPSIALTVLKTKLSRLS